MASGKPIFTEYELSEVYKALLEAACLSSANDPIQFIKNALTNYQGHDSLKDVDCHTSSAIKKLQGLVNAPRLKRIIGAWQNVAKDSKRIKEYFKIFQYLGLRDLFNCTEVCCTWKSIIIPSATLWSEINVSVEEDWISDSTMKQILQNSHVFVLHLNLRGCTSLNWSSLNYISECRNLQELNISECSNVTDKMIQRITEGCPSMLYLNLSCTSVSNVTLRDLPRNCVNLLYLSLAYCSRFTDEGFQYLKSQKGFQNLIHLNVSGCTQMTVNGFRNISDACPSLREIAIDDMITLSDSCVLALIAKCRCLSAISFLDAPNLSDITLKAIADVTKLQAFSIEGNNQVSDASWKVLCCRSPGLSRLHAAACTRMSDASLNSMAALANLQYLDISLCTKVSDEGIHYLVEGSSATKLRELNISYCSHITDVSVMRIAQKFCKLNHLNLSHCEGLTDKALELLSGSCIRSLDISGCLIQDEGLASLKQIHLKKLVLAECVYITDIGIENLCKNVSDLQHVDVSRCAALTDLAIRALSFYCRGLVTLRMPGCPKMSDMVMQYLKSAQYLRELDMRGCFLLR
ncbi:F-box and leucine-rich repeat protein 13 [Aulostomus maculatus]